MNGSISQGILTSNDYYGGACYQAKSPLPQANRRGRLTYITYSISTKSKLRSIAPAGEITTRLISLVPGLLKVVTKEESRGSGVLLPICPDHKYWISTGMQPV